MTVVGLEPKPFFPVLGRLYKYTIPLSWLVVRVAVGLNLIVHGAPHILSPAAGAPAFVKIGFENGVFMSIASTLIEFGGGVGILFGLLTRFFAAAVAIEMLMIFSLYWQNGFSWLSHGYEYVLLWGLVSFAIALRGGGPFSLDRLTGREL